MQKKVFLYIILGMREKIEDIAQILQWYELGGVDEICSEEPFNALQKQAPAPIPETPSQQLRPATTLLAQNSGGAYDNAREICTKAQTLDDLKAMMENFDGCALKFSANSTVFGYGNPNAEVMLIGEAPGADEDMQGEPFVGRSGKLLTKMLAAIGIERDDCYITNVLPWRPPGNRTPTDGEVAVCLPFLKRQIELVNPKCLFLLGGSAANALLDNADSISRMRGHIMEYVTDSGVKIPVLASFHPAYLLRSTQQKAKSWSDLMRLQRLLQEK